MCVERGERQILSSGNGMNGRRGEGDLGICTSVRRSEREMRMTALSHGCKALGKRGVDWPGLGCATRGVRMPFVWIQPGRKGGQHQSFVRRGTEAHPTAHFLHGDHEWCSGWARGGCTTADLGGDRRDVAPAQSHAPEPCSSGVSWPGGSRGEGRESRPRPSPRRIAATKCSTGTMKPLAA